MTTIQRTFNLNDEEVAKMFQIFPDTRCAICNKLITKNCIFIRCDKFTGKPHGDDCKCFLPVGLGCDTKKFGRYYEDENGNLDFNNFVTVKDGKVLK
jgi:hypothetical protein